MNPDMLDTKKDIAWFREYKGEDRIVTIDEVREVLSKEKDTSTISTKIEELDKLTEGVKPGELIIIGGLTKNGKTTLCQTLTKNFSDQGIMCAWFEYEVPTRQFSDQFDYSVQFSLPNQLKSNGLNWITERIFESIVKYDAKIIFVDHLHYLIDLSRRQNPALEIGSIVRNLKLASVALDIVIFLVCHVKDVAPGDEVTEYHLRDSRLISAEADSTWIVSRLIEKNTKEATNVARISVRNHRRTGVMAKAFKMVKIGKYFKAYTEEEEWQQKQENKKEKSESMSISSDLF